MTFYLVRVINIASIITVIKFKRLRGLPTESVPSLLSLPVDWLDRCMNVHKTIKDSKQKIQNNIYFAPPRMQLMRLVDN